MLKLSGVEGTSLAINVIMPPDHKQQTVKRPFVIYIICEGQLAWKTKQSCKLWWKLGGEISAQDKMSHLLFLSSSRRFYKPSSEKCGKLIDASSGKCMNTAILY